MTINSLAPGFVKIKYNLGAMEHVKQFQVQATGTITVGEEPSFTPNIGSPILMSTAVDALIVKLKPFFGSNTSFSSAEYWNQPTAADDPTWIFTHPIGVVGTATAASDILLQAVMTFRTALGGIYRDYLMEVSGDTSVNLNVPYPFGAGTFNDLATYLIGASGWILGRDNAALVVPIRVKTKYNDALRKKRGL